MHPFLVPLSGYMLFALAGAPELQKADAAVQPSKFADTGWPSVFPSVEGYTRFFQPMVVKGDKDNPVYSQGASYTWSGSEIRRFSVTVARNAKFKGIYNDEQVKKTKPIPEKVEVGNQRAWLWTFPPEDLLKQRLVVVLAEDRILMIEHRGSAAEGVEKWAAKFDLQKLRDALDNPPNIASRRTVEDFGKLVKGMSYSEAAKIVGKADKDIGSGIHVMVYALDDRSEVLLGFPDFDNLIYVKQRTKDGKSVDLVK